MIRQAQVQSARRETSAEKVSSPKKSMRFTKHTLLSLVSKGDPITVKDTMFLGLQFRVGQKRSVFLYEKRISAKGYGSGKKERASSTPVTFTIGAFPAISIEDARKEAQRLAGLCEQGIDPREEKRCSSSSSPSHSSSPHEVCLPFSEVVEKFFELKAGLSSSTLRMYGYIIKNHFPDRWGNIDVRNISPEMIAQQFCLVQKTTSMGGYFLKTLHNVYVTCSTLYRDEQEDSLLQRNPVPMAKALVKHVRRPQPKRSVVSHHLLGKFVVTVERIRSGEIPMSPDGGRRARLALGYRRMCDVALLSLFTAFRYNEARCLRWEYVDVEQGVIHIPGMGKGVFAGTKNRSDHFVPLSSGARDLLLRIREEAVTEGMVSPYVFPAERDPSKPASRREELFKRVSEILGTHYSPHTSRRTFASIADSAGLGFLTVKRMLNHSFEGGVTGGYVVQGFYPEKDRVHFQKVCDYILEQRAEYLGQVKRDTGEHDRAVALQKLRRFALELGLEGEVVKGDL